jgi:hypothetical protein
MNISVKHRKIKEQTRAARLREALEFNAEFHRAQAEHARARREHELREGPQHISKALNLALARLGEALAQKKLDAAIAAIADGGEQ